MLKSEVVDLLTYRLGVEGSPFAEVNVEAWHTLLAEVNAVDAMRAAKNHYANESRRLWPADVLKTAARNARVRTPAELRAIADGYLSREQ